MDTIETLKVKLAEAESTIKDYQLIIDFLVNKTRNLENVLYELNEFNSLNSFIPKSK